MSIFKYCMIVFSEDERYQTKGFEDLSHWMNNPWDGLLQDIVFGQSVDTIWKSENEGLFYMLFDMESGKRIGSGTIEYDAIREEIEADEQTKTSSASV